MQDLLGLSIGSYDSGDGNLDRAINSLQYFLGRPGVVSEVVIADERRQRSPITVKASSATVAELLGAILAKRPDFTWIEENGFLVVLPKKVLRDPYYSLNLELDYFKFSNAKPHEVFNALNERLQSRALKTLHFGSLASWEPDGGPPDLSFDGSGRTVRWVLLEMSKQREVGIQIREFHDWVGVGDQIGYVPRYRRWPP